MHACGRQLHDCCGLKANLNTGTDRLSKGMAQKVQLATVDAAVHAHIAVEVVLLARVLRARLFVSGPRANPGVLLGRMRRAG